MALEELTFRGFWTSESDKQLFLFELDLLGAETIWEEEDCIRAYLEETALPSEDVLSQLLSKYQQTLERQTVTPDNWEKAASDTISHIEINKNCMVRSSDFKPESYYLYDIIIHAHLSFGSGDHPSTLLCLEQMLSWDMKGKNVVDIGTGSGILAILAAKMGAKKVVAMDNNPWAVEVASANVMLNNLDNVVVEAGDVFNYTYSTGVDVALVNLNEQVIKSASFYLPPEMLNSEGKLLMSGFQEKDLRDIEKIMTEMGFRLKNQWSKGIWKAILLEADK